MHPASTALASEAAHIESEAGEHDLHVFEALRRMDEILVANFMVFHDLVRDDPYDLWIGDEAWELDYFLHENPELKSAAYVWLTDFVGWLPMPDGGDRESFLTADLHVEFLRSSRPGTLRAEGKVVHRTKRVVFCAAELYDAAGEHLASARCTQVLRSGR